MLAPLHERVGKNVQLGQSGIEAQTQHGETALGGGSVRDSSCAGSQPFEKPLHHLPQLAPTLAQVVLDRRLRARRHGSREHRSHLKGEGFHSVKAG
jgi:hypothetical protein